MKLYKVKRSKIDNLGLYASKNIKKGSKINEYKGKVIINLNNNTYSWIE